MTPDALLAVFSLPTDPALLVHPGHSHGLVLLSLLVAIASSVLAVHTALQMEHTHKPSLRWGIWAAGSLTLGMGVWAMHFIGMLALDWDTPVRYHMGLTLASMLPSTAAAAVALDLLARPRASAATLLWRGAAMGGGIGLMHYSGMAALDAGVAQRYDAALFALSLLLAVGVATVALGLRFWLATLAPRLSLSLRNGAVGVVMGLAVASMHYVGMAAARFVGPVEPIGGAGWDRLPLTALIVFVLAVLAGMLLGLNALVRMGQLTQILQGSEERLRALMDNLPGIALQIERAPPWRIRLASQRTRGLLGYHPASVVGQALESSIFQPDLPEQRAALQDALLQLAGLKHHGNEHRELHRKQHQELQQHLHLRLAHRDGSTHWFAARLRTGAPAQGNDPGWIDAMLEDVTDQLAAEAELQRAHYIIESSEDAIVSQDLQGTIVTWNKGAEKLFGYNANEAIGQPVAMLHDPAHSESTQAELRLIASGDTLRSHEAVRRHKNGQLLHVLVSSSPILDAAGRLQGAFKIVHDISDRKSNESLRQAKERAEQMAAMRANFLANMSHELRTPMTAVLGFTSVLLETPLNDEQTRHLRTVHNSARALLRLLNDILDTAKLERGALELEALVFNMDDVMAELEQTLGRHARNKGLHFHWQRDPGTPHAYVGDALRVRQVLSNLLDNAIKFTDKGEVAVQLGTDHGQLLLEVRDTGIGMSPEHLERIFEPFTQADATMSRRYGGTGLGTTICKQLVDLMQGDISVRSEPGRGSVFRVRLPLQVAASATAHQPHAHHAPTTLNALPPRLPRLKLLMVDDVNVNLELLHLLLHNDHDTVTCSGGAQAVELAAHNRFDLVLMDVQMPEVDGLEATRRIRANEAAWGLAPVPIIALTASVLERDREAARAAGMNGFAVKPIELNDLLAEMARVLGLDTAKKEKAMSYQGAPVLDEAAGVATWGGMREMWVETLQMLLKQIPADTAQIHQALATSHEAAIGPVHALRGAAGSLSAVALFQLLDTLETALRQKNPAQVRDCTAQLDATAQATLQAIEALLNPGAAGTATPAPVAPGTPHASTVNKAAASAALQELVRALGHGEIPTSGLQPLQQALGSLRPTDTWQALAQALDLYDFDEALRLLEELRQWLEAQPG